MRGKLITLLVLASLLLGASSALGQEFGGFARQTFGKSSLLQRMPIEANLQTTGGIHVR